MAYQAIEDYGIIGDLNTTALVCRTGSIDWCCFPHCDSPSIFAAILDENKGGYFRVFAPDADRNRQRYLMDTNVLVTRFLSPDGVGETIDFMPIEKSPEGKPQGRHRIIRRVKAIRGPLRFRVECFPAFNYGRDSHETQATQHSILFRNHSMTVELLSSRKMEVKDNGAVMEFTLETGQSEILILQQFADEREMEDKTLNPDKDYGLIETVHFWHKWLSQCNYKGRWREMVHRSALVLKLLTFQPTGAIIAAPTCSLPETLGGERNWDYRYTWIRDASFTIYSLLRIGFTEEASAFMGWLEERLRELGPDDTLGIMYRIDGTRELKEEELPHLQGYRGSKPVRIGNGAYNQLQLDAYGALMDAIYLYDNHVQRISVDLWEHVRRQVNWVCEHWQDPDEGIWEVRGGRKQFVYSKLMCWVAIDRGIRLSYKRSLPAKRNRWEKIRDRIFIDIMKNGWSANQESFIQYYGSESLDAANLLMPLVQFISPKDPRMLSTLDAVQERLTADSLVYRYLPEDAAADGLNGNEGTFSMCTFWLSECLARAGRLDEARSIFEKMISYANVLGLYSEEIGPAGEALGNFPQAFTHLGLISTAYNLDQALQNREW